MRFLARKGARFRVVPRQDVVAFTFQEGLTRLHTATEQLWMQPTLAALARRLDADTFFQVSRTAIVSLDAIREAKPFPDGTGEIMLDQRPDAAGHAPPLAPADGSARAVRHRRFACSAIV